MTVAQYETWAAFCEDPVHGLERKRSRERDYGWWQEPGYGRNVRVSWIEETGELYLFRSRGTPAYEVLLVVRDPGELDRRLDGWDDASFRPDGLDWLRERVQKD